MKEKILKQSGFSPIVIILIVVALGIIGLVAWRVYDATTQANNSLENAKTSSNVEPIKNKDKEEEKTKKLVIPYVDYEIEVPDDIKDVSFYKREPSSGRTIVQVSTKSLETIDPGCAASEENPLGIVAMGAGEYVYKPEPENSLGILVKQLPDRYISYYPPQAACSENEDAISLTQKSIKSFQNALGISLPQ